MSDNDPTGESPVFPDSTELMTVPEGNMVATDHLADLDNWDEDDEEWVSARPQRGLRLGWATAVLLVLLVAAGGFYGGAELQKHHGSSATGGRTAALAALRGAATRAGFGGTGATGTGAAAATAGLTTGTVTDVNGNVLYVTEASGDAVKVTVTPQTKVSRNASSTLAGLLPGDTVIVRGAKGANGSVSASTISATAPGVQSTTGFGGGGFTRGAGSGGFGGAGRTGAGGGGG